MTSPLPPASAQPSTQIPAGFSQSPQAQQLLAQMHDIQAPPPVDWWPPAPGWWLLAALVIAGIAALVLWQKRRRRRYAYRREALRQVAQLRQCDDAELVQQANILLKRTALTAYANDRATINRAYGQAWLEWLNRCCKQPAFTGAAATSLADGGYTAPGEQVTSGDREALIDSVSLWISSHRPQRSHHV